MDCGCPPLPAYFDQDPEICTLLIRRLIDEWMLHDFASIVPEATYNLPETLHGKHRHPAKIPMNFNDNESSNTYAGEEVATLIREVVFSESDGMNAQRGWEHPDIQDRSWWIQALRDVLIMVPGFNEFDKFKLWNVSVDDLRHRTIEGIVEKDVLEQYEHALLAFYIHSVLSVGRRPTLFFARAKRFTLNCPRHTSATF